jgi:fumarylacetoacetase
MSSSWLKIDPKSQFSLANIPFGIISTSTNSTLRSTITIGDFALDLHAFFNGCGFSKVLIITPHLWVFSQSTLNAFAGLGQQFHKEVRTYLQEIFTANGPYKLYLKRASLCAKITFCLPGPNSTSTYGNWRLHRFLRWREPCL